MEKENGNNNYNNYNYEIDTKYLKPKKNAKVNIGDNYQAIIIEPLDDKKIDKLKKEFNSFKEDLLNINNEKRMKKNYKSKSNTKQNNIKENIEIESSLNLEGFSNKKRKLNNN